MRAAATLALTLLALSCSKGPDATPALASVSSAPAARSAAVSRIPPLVSLGGEAQPLPTKVPTPGAPWIYARSLRTWVHEAPQKGSSRLGYLRAGASSPTSAKPTGLDGCEGGWFGVEPTGFVCAGTSATLDPQDPIVRATQDHPADPRRKLPYIYGVVRRQGPAYISLPTAEQLERAEPGFPKRMARWLAAEGEVGASYGADLWLGGASESVDPKVVWEQGQSDALPEFLRNGGVAPNILDVPRSPGALIAAEAKLRTGYAFYYTLLHQGRRYGLTTDLMFLPTDRLRPIRGSDFHGVQIGKDIDLPFAFVRQPKAHFWLYQRSADALLDAGPADYRAAVKLTGKQNFFNGRLYYETVDEKWLSDFDASRIDPAKKMPGWGAAGEKWIDVNITKQTMTLYDGTKPVYATLVSTGEAGLEDSQHTTATKRGIFRIHTKHVTATMSSQELGEEFELRDVPYVQYFDRQGYALHGAYWHDRFGMPKSHGCINLSPEDARRVFYFTEPALPPGWHGVLLPLKGTVLFVHP
ncbi:MAG TPA: L,D-transpeptidase [Polyangiaceae bacterium]